MHIDGSSRREIFSRSFTLSALGNGNEVTKCPLVCDWTRRKGSKTVCKMVLKVIASEGYELVYVNCYV
jgi:hypothetical protein